MLNFNNWNTELFQETLITDIFFHICIHSKLLSQDNSVTEMMNCSFSIIMNKNGALYLSYKIVRIKEEEEESLVTKQILTLARKPTSSL